MILLTKEPDSDVALLEPEPDVSSIKSTREVPCIMEPTDWCKHPNTWDADNIDPHRNQKGVIAKLLGQATSEDGLDKDQLEIALCLLCRGEAYDLITIKNEE